MQGSQHEVGKKVGLDCSWLVIHGSSHTSGYGVPKMSEKAWPKIRVARRFGAALVLQDIMQEVKQNSLHNAVLSRRGQGWGPYQHDCEHDWTCARFIKCEKERASRWHCIPCLGFSCRPTWTTFVIDRGEAQN